jgi:hypothetical protein
VSGVLSALVLVVGALALLDLFLSLAIIRRLRTMESGQAWRPEADDLTPLGTVLGPLTISTVDGASVTDAELRGGPTFVALLRVGCGPCGEFVDQVASGAVTVPARSLIVVVRDGGDEGTYADRLDGWGRVAVTDIDSAQLGAFGEVGAFPTFLRFENGVVTAADYRAGQVLARFDAAIPASRR